jgi:hypothetical protein
MFTAYSFATSDGLGVFVDVSDDTVTELIACVDNGTRVIAVDAHNRTVWAYRRPGWTCCP